MKYLIITAFLFTVLSAGAQDVKFVIKDPHGMPLYGATLLWKEQNRSFASDTGGVVLVSGIPAGKQHFVISFVGFEEQELSYTFPLSVNVVEVEMEEHESEHGVVVTTTRTSRTITNTPTRVEIISGEELEEKGNMKPGDIRMLLSESTGIQTQQTSATSYNSSIRIQGLDGRYTQILRDGYPLYSGFPGGLSIMQIAPLDLRQVEVIKGSSSTLYGGGAIAGLVNLVSKTPGHERELSFLANATTAGGLDLSGFYSSLLRGEKNGITVFASRNSTAPYDPADIGLTAIPKSERYTINPRFFFYGSRTGADIGFSYISEDRTGGNIDYIRNKRDQGYFETNLTDRFTAQAAIHHTLSEKTKLHFRNSYSHFKRTLTTNDAYLFSGVQRSGFSELSIGHKREQSEWVGGVNFLSDDFSEGGLSAQSRDYHYNTYGIFVQNTWEATDHFVLETGLRGDLVPEYGFEVLPRISALYRFSPNFAARLGGGMGYKTPTVFTEETERMQFRNIMPIDENNTENERSYGGNFDLNYRTSLGEVSLSINQLFFYTRLQKPLVLVPITSSFVYRFINANGHIDTKGMETNIRFIYGDFKLFVGYTLADVNTHYNDQKALLPLTARHRLNNVLMYEKHESLKLGLEAYYTSRQRLSDGTTGQPYWITGFMAEKIWERFSVYINFENFTDTRQTRFDTIHTGSTDTPVFRDIYAPVDGFVVNGGIKIRL
jgi:outer membrane receptor for ferrienterochelin and colicins